MFTLNFQKEWRMHKSLLISFFVIAFGLFLVITGFYLVIRNVDFADKTRVTLSNIWMISASLLSMLSTMLPIVLMYMVLKNDLGKSRIQYSIFTPQSLLSWYFPKVVFVFIIQGSFALINVFYNYFVIEINNEILAKNNPAMLIDFETAENIASFLTSTFSFGFFAMLSLTMALFYSFRNKGLTWALIVGVVLMYFVGYMIYPIIQQVQVMNGGKMDMMKATIIPFVIKNVLGSIYLAIALYLFEKKIEY